MQKRNVLLGYEVGSGLPVDIPFKHTVITGQSQQAGKTTATEALIYRSGMKALAFITKRGEGSFKNSHRIDPYFFEQADWKFVASVLEAHRGEKMKFERAWIIRASKGASTLKGVQKNVKKLMDESRGMSADVYLTLDAYLADVIPQIDKIKWAKDIKLSPGINVMDLTNINVDMQHLVIKSSLDWVLEHEENTIVIIPEAWKFIPETRGTPVKLSAEAFIRQAAGLRNYLWIDSQDIAGISKLILKSVPLWILGVQREENEIKRTLKEIPAGIKRPKPEDIAHLELGQFYACWGKDVHHTYVQPAWMSDISARQVAMGLLDIDDVSMVQVEAEPIPDLESGKTIKVKNGVSIKVDVEKQDWSKLLDDMETNRAELDYVNEEKDMEVGDEWATRVMDVLDRIADAMSRHGEFHDGLPAQENVSKTAVFSNGNGYGTSQTPILDEDALFDRFVQRLSKNRALLKVAFTIPEIEIETIRPVVQMGDNLQGWVVLLISEGFFDKGANGQSTFDELHRRGKKLAKPNVYPVLRKLANLGALTIDRQGKSEIFTRNPDLKITRKEK